MSDLKIIIDILQKCERTKNDFEIVERNCTTYGDVKMITIVPADDSPEVVSDWYFNKDGELIAIHHRNISDD